MAIKDITGNKFNRLTALFFHQTKHGAPYWWCVCDCPAQTLVSVNRYHLEHDHTRSCGCLKAEEFAKRNTKHGFARKGKKSATYLTWEAMLKRCYWVNMPQFEDYGGRGIHVCERWHDFVNFLADMGERPYGLTLDRIDVNKDYGPDNCRWATWKEQQRNRRNNHFLTLNGVTKTLAEWSELTGFKHSTLIIRKKTLGWSDEKTLTTPLRGQGPKRPFPRAACHPERPHLAKGLCSACYMAQRRQEACLPKKGEQLLLAI